MSGILQASVLKDSASSTSNLTLDASGNVTVGNNLTVTGSTTVSATSIGNLTYTGTLTGSTGILNIGSGQIYKDASGNVGIGTSNPASIAKLAVANTATTDNNRMGVAGSTYLSTPSYTATFIQQGDTATTGTICGLSNVNLGALYFQNVSAGLIYTNGASLVFGTVSTERMRIDTSGNVGIGTTSASASAILDAQSTTKGVRFPNMTTTQKNAISSPAAGLVVFDTTLAKLCVYSGSAWQTITSI